MSNIYWIIFKNSALAHFILTFDSDFAYEFAIYYNSDILPATLASLAGSMSGLTLSYLLFYIIGHIFKKYFESSYNFKPLKHYYTKYRLIITSVVAVPYLSITATFFSGLLRLSPKSIIPIFLLYRVAYYCYFLLTVN